MDAVVCVDIPEWSQLYLSKILVVVSCYVKLDCSDIILKRPMGPFKGILEKFLYNYVKLNLRPKYFRYGEIRERYMLYYISF